MMKMKVCKFNDQGYEEYKKLITEIQNSVSLNNNNIHKGYTSELKERIKLLKSEERYSDRFEHDIEFEIRKFENRHVMGIYLENLFKDVPTYKLENNFKLWDWICLQYFDEIFTTNGTASDWRFRLIDDHKLKFRNLMYVPWWIIRHYGESDSRIFLLRLDLDVGGDWNEQYMKKNHVRNYKKIAHICHILYFDEEEKRDIPGTSKSNIGALQDFCDEIKYLNLIYDLFEMPTKEILKKLPKRFFNFMKKIGKEVEIDGEIFS